MGSITIMTTGGSGPSAEEVISFTQEEAQEIAVTRNPLDLSSLTAAGGTFNPYHVDFGQCDRLERFDKRRRFYFRHCTYGIRDSSGRCSHGDV